MTEFIGSSSLHYNCVNDKCGDDKWYKCSYLLTSSMKSCSILSMFTPKREFKNGGLTEGTTPGNDAACIICKNCARSLGANHGC